LAAHHTMIITPSLYLPHQSLLIILFCVFGGAQYFWGAALGAIVLGALPIFFNGLAGWYQILYGALFVILMIVRPQGLIGRSVVDCLRSHLRRSRPAGDSPSTTAREEQPVA